MAQPDRVRPVGRNILPESSNRFFRSGRFRPAFEQLESRLALTTPFGAAASDTGEFLLGKVYVNVVFMESDGTVEPSTENWNALHRQQTKTKIEGGLNWWKDTLIAAGFGANPLDFTIDYTYADAPVATSYEPINQISDFFELWVEDFFDKSALDHNLTYTGFTFSEKILQYNHFQRNAHNADWSFTILVANSQNDADERFPVGGSFTGAFAYAGGQLIVIPSDRPNATFAHEVGHMFWAFDEYAGSKSYYDRRGYYNTQNLNATDANPSPGTRVNSIMSNGAEMDGAFASHTSAVSSLQMIGWRDSDNDGLFDVIDVPHQLTGYGTYNTSTGMYHFTGESQVRTLPNLNPSGLQNDITINRIRRADYRVDGGAWQTAASYDAHSVALDFEFFVAPGNHNIEIRTFDNYTGVASNLFTGSTLLPSATLLPGVNGFVWNDINGNGLRENGEPGLSGWTVRLVDGSQIPLQLTQTIEPDNYAQDTTLNNVLPGVTLTAVGTGVTTNLVIARDRSPSSTGTKVFTHQISSGISAAWTQTTRQLRIDFASPVTTLSLDAIGNTVGSLDYGRLEIYNAANELIGRYTTEGLGDGNVETMTLNRPTADIKYAIARAHAGTALHFDNLKIGPQATTTTNDNGEYALPWLAPTNYEVQALAPGGFSFTTASQRSVSLTAGEGESGVDFGANNGTNAFPWHNTAIAEDVDGNGVVNNTDAFLIISELRNFGSHALPGSPGLPLRYWDVVANGQLSNNDAFAVIAKLRAQSGGGEGENSGGGGASSGGGAGEGEFQWLIDLVNSLETSTHAGSGSTSLVASLPDVLEENADPLVLDVDDHHHQHDEDLITALQEVSASLPTADVPHKKSQLEPSEVDQVLSHMEAVAVAAQTWQLASPAVVATLPHASTQRSSTPPPDPTDDFFAIKKRRRLGR